MFCSKCGLQLADTIKICPRCRNVIAPTAQPIRPVYQQPTYQQPTYPQPTYQQPVYQQPVYRQPVYQQPVYQQPVYQQPVQPPVVPPQPQPTPAPVAEEPVAEPTVVEEPVVPVAEPAAPVAEPAAPVAEPATPVAEPVAPAAETPFTPAEPQPFVVPKQVNVPLGILGSLLGALAGGVVWFLLGMFGIITGYAGIIMVGLGLFLFKKFSGTQNSILGVIVTVALAIITIFAAEYMVIAYTLFDVGIVPTFGAGLRYGLEMINMVPDLSGAVWTDILLGFVFSALGSVGIIIEEIKARSTVK